jgi:hypothetical protein
MTDPKMTKLDDLFAECRAETPAPSDALMARVLGDAQALQPDAPGLAAPAPVPERLTFWDMLGGWPALSGIAAAGVVGVWFGISPSAGIEDIASDVFGNTASVSFVAEYDDFLGELTDG